MQSSNTRFFVIMNSGCTERPVNIALLILAEQCRRKMKKHWYNGGSGGGTTFYAYHSKS